MTKSLRKAILLRYQLKRKYYNNKSEENSKKYKEQKNYCVKRLRKRKMKYLIIWTLVGGQPYNRIRLSLSAVNHMKIKNLIHNRTFTKCFKVFTKIYYVKNQKVRENPPDTPPQNTFIF